MFTRESSGVRLRLLIACALIFCATSESSAWGPAGHKIIASIAFRRLAPETQAKIVTLLRQHPRYQADFADKMPNDLASSDANEWIVQQAAIWPDLARDFKGDGLKEKYHRGPWHFINVPTFLTDADEQALKDKVKATLNLQFSVPDDPGSQSAMNVMQAIAHSRAITFDARARPEDRALHLSWLIHLVGDLHQPLHSTAMFSQKLFPDGDRGGNKIQTVQRTNLHMLWDDLPGSPPFSATRSKATRLLSDAQMSELGTQAAQVSDTSKWLDESHTLAVTVAYDSEVTDFLRRLGQNQSNADVPRLSLSEDYLKRAGDTATRRLVQAGYRLGKLLEGVP